MNRDATIVQVAMFLIIIAILGVAILKQQRNGSTLSVNEGTITPIKEAVVGNVPQENNKPAVPQVVDPVVDQPSKPTELLESDNINIVKQYFRYIAEKDYGGACSLIAGSKCDGTKPVAVANFSREFEKFANGYEYTNVRDFGLTAPSGKDVVCVKYSYRYKDDPQPGLVSEVMSFYVNKVGSELKITDRVCEKKYKDGRGVRDCPIQAAADFCEGLVR